MSQQKIRHLYTIQEMLMNNDMLVLIARNLDFFLLNRIQLLLSSSEEKNHISRILIHPGKRSWIGNAKYQNGFCFNRLSNFHMFSGSDNIQYGTCRVAKVP